MQKSNIKKTRIIDCKVYRVIYEEIDDNLKEVHEFVIGLPEIPFEGGYFKFCVSVSYEYPFKSPKFKFKTKISMLCLIWVLFLSFINLYLKSIKYIVILLKEIIVNIIIDFKILDNILDNIIILIYLWVFEGNF